MVVRVFDRESLLCAPIYILSFRSECCESKLDFPYIKIDMPQSLFKIEINPTIYYKDVTNISDKTHAKIILNSYKLVFLLYGKTSLLL
jgi:hypothetical protein